MTELRSTAQEVAEDIFFGQVVIIWARWFVIIAGVIVVIWTSNNAAELTLAVLMLVPLIAVNFFVHGRYMMEKPINQNLLVGLSLLDIVIITLIVAFWQDPSGFYNPYFIFYYPILLAFAFVFPQRVSVPYIAVTLLLYGAVCLLGGSGLSSDPYQVEGLVIRLITMAAVGGLAGYYWRIQRNRRRGALKTVKPLHTAPAS